MVGLRDSVRQSAGGKTADSLTHCTPVQGPATADAIDRKDTN